MVRRAKQGSSKSLETARGNDTTDAQYGQLALRHNHPARLRFAHWSLDTLPRHACIFCSFPVEEQPVLQTKLPLS